MDFLRVGEALLRFSPPLLPFLAPASYRVPPSKGWAALSKHTRQSRIQCQPQRPFSSSHIRHAQSAAAVREQDEGSRKVGSSTNNSRSQQSQTASEISAMLDSSLQLSKTKASSSAKRPGRTSIDDLMDIMTPTRSSRSRTSVNDAFPGRSQEPPEPLEPLPFKLGPTVGRTINVDVSRGMDVGRVFRQLDMQIARNKVRATFQKQRFHERPGMKRKRLKSERWRRRFKQGFKETIKMVEKMRRQGW